MKEKVSSKKKTPTPKPLPAAPVSAAVKAAEKQLEKAKDVYKQKMEAYEAAEKQNAEKIILKRLQAAAKIAKLTYKIKGVEYKLAKSNWKASTKVEKKQAA